MKNNNFGEKSGSRLFQLMKEGLNPEYIDFSNNNLSENSIKTLIKVIRSFPSIEGLDVRENPGQSKRVKIL